ncbi:unnamed protein product [Soboliphyme baturini]|uniref:ABC transporter permease n=1 Tax=Soboliphyme baturini TaxID=241478 RepID=A0A183IR84_9BILA|nr:unnamed protein product [Soboliphyme baturini]
MKTGSGLGLGIILSVLVFKSAYFVIKTFYVRFRFVGET